MLYKCQFFQFYSCIYLFNVDFPVNGNFMYRYLYMQRTFQILLTNLKLKCFRWYKRDDNAVPPVYVLQRISTLLPDFVSTNKEDRNKAKADWWTDSDKMQDLLAAAAEKCLGPEKSRNYLVSGKKKTHYVFNIQNYIFLIGGFGHD